MPAQHELLQSFRHVVVVGKMSQCPVSRRPGPLSCFCRIARAARLSLRLVDFRRLALAHFALQPFSALIFSSRLVAGAISAANARACHGLPWRVSILTVTGFSMMRQYLEREISTPWLAGFPIWRLILYNPKPQGCRQTNTTERVLGGQVVAPQPPRSWDHIGHRRLAKNKTIH